MDPTHGRREAPAAEAGGRRRWLLEPEMLVALGALLASLSAVGVSAYEAYLQRKYDRASVWPRVELTSTYGPDGARVEAVNSGLGPALIEAAIVTVDGRRVANWPEALARLFGQEPRSYSMGTVRDRAVRAGDSALMVSVPGQELARIKMERLDHVGMVVCYSSVYGERWELVVPGMGPGSPPSSYRSVERCPRTAQGF